MRDGSYPVQGTVRAKVVSLRLGFGGDDFSYAIDFGLPVGAQSLITSLRHATQGADTEVSAIELIKDFGETRVRGREPLDEPAWRWPKR